MQSASAVYARTKKERDSFWNAYVCRPVAALVVAALADTPITPNQITLTAFGLALLGSVGLGRARPGWEVLAAVIVIELAYVLDCADGMLARWRGIASQAGHLLDFLMDEIKAFVLLGAAAIHLWRAHDDVRWLLAGVVGLVCLATGIAITTFQRRPEIAGSPDAAPAPGGTPAPRRSLVGRALDLAQGVAKFLIHYPSYLFYVGVVGRLELYVVPYVAINALYALRALAWVTIRFGRSGSAR